MSSSIFQMHSIFMVAFIEQEDKCDIFICSICYMVYVIIRSHYSFLLFFRIILSFSSEQNGTIYFTHDYSLRLPFNKPFLCTFHML